MNVTTQPQRSRGTYRATITGVGIPGPIEQRVGRRLVRLVDPDTKEGSSLLRSGRVTFLGPEGEPLGCTCLAEAMGLLRARLEQRLASSSLDDARERALRDGLNRLGAQKFRLGAG